MMLNLQAPIYVGYYSNEVISRNTIVNTSTGIFVYAEGSNTTISNNLLENLPGFGSMSYGIDAESFYGGYNAVSHNTVTNPGSGGVDININDGYPVLAFSNNLTGGEYGFFAESTQISLFGNTVSSANHAIYSAYNYNFSYYSNTITNANYSFYSYEDEGGSVFANTFIDAQANSPSLYFLYLYYNEGPLSFFHNNFINSTTNSTTYFYLDGVPYNGPVSLYQQFQKAGHSPRMSP